MKLRFIAALLALVPAAGAAVAQTRPTASPTYLPTGILTAQSLTTAAAATPYVLQNESNVLARITGTFSGLTGVFQVSNDPTAIAAASATWTNVGAESVGGTSGVLTTITATGLYRVPTNGAVRVRFNPSALTVTGSNALVLTMTGSISDHMPGVSIIRRPTYQAYAAGLTPVASLTDIAAISGSATATIRVLSARCDGIATGTGVTTLSLVRRSAANTGSTPVAMTTVLSDTNDPAATATVTAYGTTNPTVGTLVGRMFTGQMFYNIAATTSLTPNAWLAQPSGLESEGWTLRGAAQTIAINGEATSQPSGAALNCGFTWTE